MGSDGLGQPVEAVQVVVGGQVLLAGSTDGPGLEASSKHAYMGEVLMRVSSEPARGQSILRGPPGAPTPGRGWCRSRTRHVGGMLQVIVGAAILGALHKV